MDNPIYEKVTLESEAVRVYYDPDILELKHVLNIYWEYLNPDDDYTTCYAKVFYANEYDRLIMEDFFRDKDVRILKDTGFHMADKSHQNYYKTQATLDYFKIFTE